MLLTDRETAILQRLNAGEHLHRVGLVWMFNGSDGEVDAETCNGLMKRGYLTDSIRVSTALARRSVPVIDWDKTAKALETQNANRD